MGHQRSDPMRLAFVENEQRIRQAARSIKRFFGNHSNGSNVVPIKA